MEQNTAKELYDDLKRALEAVEKDGVINQGVVEVGYEEVKVARQQLVEFDKQVKGKDGYHAPAADAAFHRANIAVARALSRIKKEIREDDRFRNDNIRTLLAVVSIVLASISLGVSVWSKWESTTSETRIKGVVKELIESDASDATSLVSKKNMTDALETLRNDLEARLDDAQRVQRTP